MKYELDFDKWILTMLPTFLRRRGVFVFCRALCHSIKRLYLEFLDARKEHNFNVSHNGQVCYLRSALNERFDTTGFEICDSLTDNGRWLYAKDEPMAGQTYAVDESVNKEPDTDPDLPKVPVVYDETRLNLPQDTFVVFVPAKCAGRMDEVRAIVDRFRILSKQPVYNIKQY